MKKYTFLILAFFTLISCSTRKTIDISQDVFKESKKVCLNSEGRGRIELPQGKYTFSYESAYLEDENKFVMVLSFPIYGEERFEINLDDLKKNSNHSLEHRIVSASEGVSPQMINTFITLWAEYFTELLGLQGRNEITSANFKWKIENQIFHGDSTKNPFFHFYSKAFLASKDFFQRLTFELKNIHDKTQDRMIIELFVRECLEKPE